MKKFFKDETGDTNIVSLIILIGVIGVAVLIFRPYLQQLVQSLLGG